MYNGLSILLGKPHSGKSHLIKYLVREICNSTPIQMVLLFSKSSGTPQYNYIPSQWQYDGFDIDKLNQVYRMQRALQMNGFKPLSILLIFDDCIDKRNGGGLFLDVINNHRHLNLTIIYSLQFLSGNISTNFREVVNRAFLFRQDSETAIKSSRASFIPWIDTKEYSTINFNLPKYSFIHVNRGEQSCEVSKAPESIPEYRILYRNKITPESVD